MGIGQTLRKEVSVSVSLYWYRSEGARVITGAAPVF